MVIEIGSKEWCETLKQVLKSKEIKKGFDAAQLKKIIEKVKEDWAKPIKLN